MNKGSASRPCPGVLGLMACLSLGLVTGAARAQAVNLVTPEEDAVLPNGCEGVFAPLVWDFDWADVPGATAYHLWVWGPNATVALIDQSSLPSSSYSSQSSGYVLDSSRFGWRWRVRARVNDTWGDWTEERTFHVESQDAACLRSVAPDEYEPDDGQLYATRIVPDGAPQRHTFHAGDPADWVSFAAVAGHMYDIWTDNLTGTVDTVLTVGATSGELARDDDGGPGRASRIEDFISPLTATLYVRITDFAGGDAGSYDIAVLDETGGVPVDVYEFDNNRPAATAIATDGVAQQHTFHPGDEVDWVQFQAGAGARYAISVTDMQGDIDPLLVVTTFTGELNPNGWLAYDDYTGEGPGPNVPNFVSSRTETLYVVVQDFARGAGGSYSISILRLDPPAFALRSAWVYDPLPGGNSDAGANPGERILPRVRLRNDGPGSATTVTVTLSTTDPDVTVVEGVMTHGNWPAHYAQNNGELALDIALDAAPHDVAVTVDVTADNAGPWQFTFTFPIVASPVTFTKRNAWNYEPTPATRNGQADTGEVVYPRVRLYNVGPEDATNVTVTFSSDDHKLTITDRIVTHATWPAGEARNNVGPEISITPESPSRDVTVIVDVTADVGGPWRFLFTFPVVAPGLTFTSRNAWVFEPTADTRNGQADAGERVHPRVRLMNEGPADAENVVVTITTDDPDLTVVQGSVSHAAWPAGVARNNEGFVLDIAPSATLHLAYLTVDVTADNAGPWQFRVNLPVAPAASEFTKFTKRNAWLYEPTTATRNGQADVGERVRPRVRLMNEGPADAMNVTVTLSADDPDVTVVDGVVSHATWPAGVARNNDGFVLDIASNAASHEASMTVDVTADNGGPWQFTFTFPVVAPALTFTKRNAWVYEPTASTRNGQADAGERVQPRVRLKNDGPEDAENVTVTLSTDDPDVTVVNGTATHATWPVGAARNNDGLVLDISSEATPHDVTLTVDVTAEEGGPWQFTFILPVVASASTPTFVKRNAWIYDPTPRADKDGVAEPGERVRPRIRLVNGGPADAANVGVTLTITDEDVTVVRAEETHATWPEGAARTIVGFVLDIAKD
ncbi:hypothetical protein CMK11_00910, partial [Candidatus Poribacteria bacterium]|nr:hypothetical protein [Candidatus Poribacteria bacterium]